MVARISRDQRPSRAQAAVIAPRAGSSASRTRTRFARRTLQQSKNFFYVVAMSRIVHNVYSRFRPTPPPKTPALGDKVVVRLEPWNRGTSIPKAYRSSGARSAPRCDMLSIIRKYHLPTRISGNVPRAEKIPETVGEEWLRTRGFAPAIHHHDRSRRCARLDDAIMSSGSRCGWQLGVHIATCRVCKTGRRWTAKPTNGATAFISLIASSDVAGR